MSKFQPIVATGYVLATGESVFLASDGAWRADIAGAVIANTQAESENLREQIRTAEANAEIVDGYAIEVEEIDGQFVPVKMREKHRLQKQPSFNYLPN